MDSGPGNNVPQVRMANVLKFPDSHYHGIFSTWCEDTFFLYLLFHIFTSFVFFPPQIWTCFHSWKLKRHNCCHWHALVCDSPKHEPYIRPELLLQILTYEGASFDIIKVYKSFTQMAADLYPEIQAHKSGQLNATCVHAYLGSNFSYHCLLCYPTFM